MYCVHSNFESKWDFIFKGDLLSRCIRDVVWLFGPQSDPAYVRVCTHDDPLPDVRMDLFWLFLTKYHTLLKNKSV